MFHKNFKQLLDHYKNNHPQVSNAQVAKALGLSPQAFSYYLNGREPNYDILIKIAKFFEVSTDYLLGNEEFTSKIQKENVKELGISKEAALLLSKMQGEDAVCEKFSLPKKYNIACNLNILITTHWGREFLHHLNCFLDIKYYESILELNENQPNCINIPPNLEYISLVNMQLNLLKVREELVRKYKKEMEEDPTIEEIIKEMQEMQTELGITNIDNELPPLDYKSSDLLSFEEINEFLSCSDDDIDKI